FRNHNRPVVPLDGAMKTKMKMLNTLTAVIFLGTFSGCCHLPERIELRAPSVLPNTTRQMKTAGFWISRITDPDRVVLTTEEIDALNAHTQDQAKLIEDIMLGTPIEGKEVVTDLTASLNAVRERALFLPSGEKAGEEFFGPIVQRMNLEALPDQITLRYGVVVHGTDQRVLPTTEALYAEKGDVDFDELQNSGLDVGTPVLILHQSQDGQWIYGKTQFSAGWVQAQDVAEADLDAVKRFSARDQIVVVTVPKADIFLNKERTKYDDYVRMGTVLPLTGVNGDLVEVVVPVRNLDGALVEVSGYLKADEVSIGFLPYTARTMIKQAFKMLNTPYGWGDMYGEQDCSRFIQEIFSTVGILMPRNSSQQAQVGVLVSEFSDQDSADIRIAAFQQAVSGVTTLYMKGHILLYLGSVEGRPFAIHASWGYREKAECPGPQNGQACRPEVIRVMNRVVVSDLSLGEGSWKKSLLERLLSVRQVRGLKEK
ncbi:MAG TPA: SH3 domain-containing protein, partial [Candidatus Bathyarchaeia archaeon]|nr:SH3 domain-containing protein [Candidatus Bathyarchaeia archaeon]